MTAGAIVVRLVEIGAVLDQIAVRALAAVKGVSVARAEINANAVAGREDVLTAALATASETSVPNCLPCPKFR